MNNRYIIKTKLYVSFAILSFAWLGLVGNNISARLGGVGYILVAYVLMMFSIYKPIRIPTRKIGYLKALIFFMAFSAVFAFGMQIFKVANRTVDIYMFNLSADMYNIIINMPIWVACVMVILKCCDNEVGQLSNIIFWFTLYNVSIALYALNDIPEFSRNLAAAISTSEMKRYIGMGAIGYELTYSMSILIPLFFVIYKVNNHKKWVVLGLISTLLVLKSAFLIAIVALVINIGISFALGIKREHLRWLFLVMIFIASIFIINNIAALGGVLIKLGLSLPAGDVQTHIIQIGRMIAYGDFTGDTLVRFELYERSLSGLFRSPLFGQLIFDSSYVLSRHSTVLDTWCGLGILPIALFFVAVRLSYKFAVQRIYAIEVRNVFISAYVTFFLIATLNPVLAAPQIMLTVMVLIPMFGMLIGVKANVRT